jgi:putative ABC transport system permease protein
MVRTSAQVIYQDNNWYTQIQGVNTDFPDVRNWDVESGVFFSAADQRTGARVCIIGRTIANNLFPNDDPIGKDLRIRNIPFRVLGVMAGKGSNSMGSDQDDAVIAPYTTVKRVLQNSIFNNVNMLLVSLYSLSDIPAAKDEIGKLLRQRHKLAPHADDDFSTLDMTEITNTIGSITKLMTILLTTVASISLLVGGIGIMNIMLVSVTERTREIGLRKAIGARKRDILVQFLSESILLSLVGGIIGILLAWGISTLIGAIAAASGTPIEPQIGIDSIALATLFSMAVGLLFGLYPANRAASLQPVEALRYE